jgi:hypothetical protein
LELAYLIGTIARKKVNAREHDSNVAWLRRI